MSALGSIHESIARTLSAQRHTSENSLEIEMLGMDENAEGKVVKSNLLDLPSEILITMMKAGNFEARDAVALKRTAKRFHHLVNKEETIWRSIYKRITGFDSSTRCQDKINQLYFETKAPPLLYLSRECDPQHPFTAKEYISFTFFHNRRLRLVESDSFGIGGCFYEIVLYAHPSGDVLEDEHLRYYSPGFVVCDGAIVVRDRHSGTILIYTPTLKPQGTLPMHSFPTGMCSFEGKLLVKYKSGKLIEYTFMPDHDLVLGQIAEALNSETSSMQEEAIERYYRMPDQIKKAILEPRNTWGGLRFPYINRNELAVALRKYFCEKT